MKIFANTKVKPAVNDYYKYLLFLWLLMSLSACSAKNTNASFHKLRVSIKKDTVQVRFHFNEHEDLIKMYVRNGNDSYTPETTYIGKNTEQDEVIMKTPIHYIHDSTAPIFNSQTLPWHLFMQHGYCIPKLEAKGHQLTNKDIGSTWRDEQGREYTLGRIRKDDLFMLPRIRETEIEGLFLRDWEHPHSGYPIILHHLSGGIHTGDIRIDKGSYYQIRPIQKTIKRDFYVDGRRVTECGIYECDEFTITEELSCLNPFTVETWFPQPVMKDEMLRITQTFTFCGLSTSYNTQLNVKYPIMFESYGCNQAKHLLKYKEYDAYVLLPRVRKLYDGHRVDIPFVQNSTKGHDIKVKRNEDELYDINRLPDREISFLYHPVHGYKLGFASGLSLTEGISADTSRVKYVPIGSLAIVMSPSNRNKMYIKAINKEAFEYGLLPRGFVGEFHSYFSYFDPSQNVGQVYWYKDGEEYYIYAHCQSKNGVTSISLPAIMNEYELSVVDKTSGVELKSKTVKNNHIWLDYKTEDANYIVLKVRKNEHPDI